MANFSNAWIGWQNFFHDFSGTLSASGFENGFPVANLANWYTWQRWKGDATGPWWVKVDCGQPRGIDYCAIGGHSLNGHTITLQGSNDDATWVDIVDMTPGGSAAQLYNGVYYYDGGINIAAASTYGPNHIAVRVSLAVYQYYRVLMSGGVGVPSIGIVSIGRALEFPLGFYGGFPRPKWNELTQTTNSVSERGLFLGRSVQRVGLRPYKVTLTHMRHDWIDNYWMPFKEHAELKPFVFVWEHAGIAVDVVNNTDCAIAWGQVDASPLKDQRFASASIQCEGSLK